jgi:hypothetical protein
MQEQRNVQKITFALTLITTATLLYNILSQN